MPYVTSRCKSSRRASISQLEERIAGGGTGRIRSDLVPQKDEDRPSPWDGRMRPSLLRLTPATSAVVEHGKREEKDQEENRGHNHEL